MAKKTNKTTTKVKEQVTNKKTETLKQIENLEKALENIKSENIVNLVPEDIKEDVKADIEASEEFGKPETVNIENELREIIENTEPSEEIKEQFQEFENGKNEFNEKLEKNPQEAEKLIEDEIKRVEELKKKAETIKANIQKENKRTYKNSDFTNWWNGSSNLF